MSSQCLVVLTARGLDRILCEGGSQAWRLKAKHAAQCEYCICVQNRHNGHWGEPDHKHHQAFLVGRISDVVPAPGRPTRYLVLFSEYARIDYANAWPGLRNPVHYSTFDEFGITDPARLQWHPMPTAVSGAVELVDIPVEPLTIAEAKAGLALGPGVPESAIEITVRA